MPFPIKLNDYNNGEMACCIGDPNLDKTFLDMMLQMAGGQDVLVDVSSIGGNAFHAMDMYDLLKRYGNADVYIGALAASSASIIAMGGRKVTMSKNALMMIHKPAVPSGGNADELTKDIELLNIMQGRLASVYMDKTGLDEDTINSLINATTWMTAEQALSLGFIDEIADYDTPIVNAAEMIVFTQAAAPAYYKAVINKINIPKQEVEKEKSIMSELSEKALKVLNKIGLFVKDAEVKTVTNKGTVISFKPIAKGVAVFNEAGDEPAKDDEYTVDNAGKKSVFNVKEGKVENMADDEDEPGEDTEEVEAKAIINRHKIVVTNTADNKVIAGLLAKIETQNALLAENSAVTNELVVENKKTREEIQAEIKSKFTPDGSQRSVKGVVNQGNPFALTSDVAKNSVKKVLVTNPDKA